MSIHHHPSFFLSPSAYHRLPSSVHLPSCCSVSFSQKPPTMSTTEPMINDTIGSLLRDRGSGVNASTFHPYPRPVFCLGLSAACNPPLQGTVTPTNTVFLAQPLERHTLESSHPTLPHVSATPPQHPSPQFLSSNQVPTAPSQLLVLRLGLQHAYHQKQQQRQHTQLQLQHAFILNQPKRERLQLQLVRQDEEIQELQWQLANLQQQLLSQQLVPQIAMQPWASVVTHELVLPRVRGHCH